MPNPFYTPKQKSIGILIVSQWVIFSLLLIFLKLTFSKAFTWSWWYITAPLWGVPVLFFFVICILVIAYGIRQDNARMKQYLLDLEKQELKKRKSCLLSCSPIDYCKGGKCDQNGCYEHK